MSETPTIAKVPIDSNRSSIVALENGNAGLEYFELQPRKDHKPDAIDMTPLETPTCNSEIEVVAIVPVVPLNAFTVRTAKHRRSERIHFLALCWCLLLCGWNDGSTGPLLPTIQRYYSIDFRTVSVLFIMACFGFFCGAAANVSLTDHIGLGKTVVLGALLQCVGISIQIIAPPFPVLVFGYLLMGFGGAFVIAQANGYVASLQENASSKMGLLHAAYGVGALISPLVATQFAPLKLWSLHYLTSLGIGLFNVILLLCVFKGRHHHELLESIGQAAHDISASEGGKFRQIWRTKNVHLLAAFIVIYVGVEVTTGGWIVTFIIQKRHGGPSSGYVSSGFFGGLTLGRVALLWVNHKIGEYRAIYLYSFLALGLELIIWFVPSLIGNAVAVSLVGVLLGPMYPIVVNHSARIIPRWMLTGAIGWTAGVGQTGSALLPFITGSLASKFGIAAMPPFMVINVCLLIGFWTLVPSKYGRSD